VGLGVGVGVGDVSVGVGVGLMWCGVVWLRAHMRAVSCVFALP